MYTCHIWLTLAHQNAVCRFSVCARDEGNVARFINHSCDPNLYVQPVLSGHTDTDHVVVGLFAAYDIPPFTALR
jgi:euchromatic histone-lysine N-methyltransferase